MKKRIIITIYLSISLIFVYSQKESNILYELGANLSMSLNREIFSNQGVLIQPSMKRTMFFSITFPKSVYIEAFYTHNDIQLSTLEINNFDDLGILLGMNLINTKNNSVKIAIGPYYRLHNEYNLYQNGFRFGLISNASFGVNLGKGVSLSVVWRETLDFLGGDDNNQLFLSQSSLGFSLSSSLNQLINMIKNKKNSYY